MWRIRLVVLLIVLSTIVNAQDAQDAQWAMEEWDQQASDERAFSGFVELALGARLASDPVLSKDITLADVRAQLQWDKHFTDASLAFTADLYYDGVRDQTRLQLRELAWQGNLSVLGQWGKQFDLKLGQQILTWGTGDYVFLNDLFPKDFQSFFAGRDDDYLKAPSLAAKVSGFFDWVNVDLVITPQFSPDQYINGDYFSFFSPLANANVAPGFTVSPPHRPQSPEYAVRIYKTIDSVEYALYGYQGFHKSPLSLTQFNAPRFSALEVYGASVITSIANGLLNVEMAYYDSIEDPQGDNPRIENSQTRWLVGCNQHSSSHNRLHR